VIEELAGLGLRDLKLLRKGAEAHIYEGKWLGRPVIVKHRVVKAYRHPRLDEAIRARRTVREAQALHRAKEAGVPTPMLFLVDRKSATIVMEAVEGTRLKELLAREGRKALGKLRELGLLVGKLHKAGLVHGDITTSNVIVAPDGSLVLIDFGLSEFSTDVERRGVDLHLFKRVLESTHHEVAGDAWLAFTDGYRAVMGPEAGRVLDKVHEIELRGRYVAERRRRQGQQQA